MIPGTTVTTMPRFEVDARSARIPRGGEGRLVVTVRVPEGCHVQSHTPAEPFLIPTTLELDEGQAFSNTYEQSKYEAESLLRSLKISPVTWYLQISCPQPKVYRYRQSRSSRPRGPS